MSEKEKNSTGIERGAPTERKGNASNPPPQDPAEKGPGKNQLLDENAEKYLRESANIEDLPDARDQAEMDETIENENQEG